MKKGLLVLVSLCLMMGMLAGCGNDAQPAASTSGGAPASSSPEGSPGDASASPQGGASASDKTQLNVATELFPATLEPATNWDSWYVVRWGAGETLVKFAEDGSYAPWLAESWEVADDNLTWTFKLKEGVAFSNGEAMTATKVKQSIERLFELEDTANGGTGNPQGHFTYGEITADDAANELVIKTNEPTPDLPGCLAYPWTLIVDADACANIDVSTQGPICTGPYKFASFTQDTDIQMARNENFWDGDVPFESINIMKVDEPSTRTMALQDGSVDIAMTLPAADREMLEQEGKYDVSVVAGTRVGYAHMNNEGVLGNEALRQAVLMAIDGQTIADVTTSGSYTYSYAVIPPSYGEGKLENKFGFDTEAAKKALDEAGIVDGDGDGYRELDGKKIELDYKVSVSRQMDQIAQAQASQLEAIGIGCKIQTTDTLSEVLNNHMFDLATSNEVTTPTGDPAKYMRHWYSTSDDNYAQYNNPEYDKVYDQLATEFDAEKRKEYIVQLQQILLDDAEVLVFGYFNYNMCSAPTITGAKMPADDFYWLTKDIKPAE